MSSVIKCDGCGKVSESTEPIGWFHIEIIGAVIYRTVIGRGQERTKPTGDFCSSACAIAKLQERDRTIDSEREIMVR